MSNVTATLPEQPGPSTTEMLALSGGIGAGLGSNVLAQRAILSGVAIESGLVMPVVAAGLTGVTASAIGGYELGKAINKIPGVQEAAVATVEATFNGAQYLFNGAQNLINTAQNLMMPKTLNLADVAPPSFADIANIVSSNSHEGTYTSATDIVGSMNFGTGHDTSTLFLWP